MQVLLSGRQKLLSEHKSQPPPVGVTAWFWVFPEPENPLHFGLGLLKFMLATQIKARL